MFSKTLSILAFLCITAFAAQNITSPWYPEFKDKVVFVTGNLSNTVNTSKVVPQESVKQQVINTSLTAETTSIGIC
jgi:hypothetical protein